MAVFTMFFVLLPISEGEKEYLAMAIFTDTEQMFTPCGACRQVLAEFSQEMKVFVSNGKKTKEFTVKELLPYSFAL